MDSNCYIARMASGHETAQAPFKRLKSELSQDELAKVEERPRRLRHNWKRRIRNRGDAWNDPGRSGLTSSPPQLVFLRQMSPSVINPAFRAQARA